MSTPYSRLVGIDWAKSLHEVCVLDAQGEEIEQRQVEHKATPIAKLGDRLIEQAGGDPARVAVAIEEPRGTVVETLLERAIHVYVVNPKQLDRFRDRHTMAGAKDDRLDAYVLADVLRTDRKLLRRLELDAAQVIELRELTRADEGLRKEISRLANRVAAQIYRVAPRLSRLCEAANEPWYWDLVERMLVTHVGKPVSRRWVKALIKRNGIRRVTYPEVLAILEEPQVFVAPGAAQAARRHLALLLPRLRLAHQQRAECKQQLEQVLRECAEADDGDPDPSDVEILLSLPGAGVGIVSTMVAEASGIIARRDYAALRAHSGVAPVTRRSGKSKRVSMRYACNRRLRFALHHFARCSTTNDPAARQYYQSHRERGHSHSHALRALGNRWLRILAAMLRDRTCYQPQLQAITQAA